MITGWIDGKDKPLDDSDCLIVFQIEGQHYVRAPVSWYEEKGLWEDEWGINFKPEEVIRYVFVPLLDDGTIYK